MIRPACSHRLLRMLEGRILGVRVQVDFLFVALTALVLLTDPQGYTLVALLACLIHELGHLVMFLLTGYTPRALILELTGIRLVKPEQALSPVREALVQSAGSLANFGMFALLMGLGNGSMELTQQNLFAATHLLLGIFHLLPLKSLDGGKLLALASFRICGARWSERICAGADLLTTLGLLGMAAYMFLSGQQSLTLLIFSSGLVTNLLARLRPWGRCPQTSAKGAWPPLDSRLF